MRSYVSVETPMKTPEELREMWKVDHPLRMVHCTICGWNVSYKYVKTYRRNDYGDEKLIKICDECREHATIIANLKEVKL